MSKLEIDLDAYVIPDDHIVFKCSPGKTYRFYQAVRAANAVFPDVRGLGQLEGDPEAWSDALLLRAISSDRWERELQSRGRGNKAQGSEGVTTIDRRTLTFLKRLYFEGKKGDLVVVPADGYDKDVLIGQLLTDAGDLRRVRAKDGDHEEEYFGRPVAWIKALPKYTLNGDLIQALHTRAAVFALGRSLREEIYRIAYGNFIYLGRYVCEFRTEKDRFTAEDSAVLGMWLNGFDVLRNAIESGDEPYPNVSFFELGLTSLPDEFAADLRVNIQSPGEVFVRSVTPFAIALMAMFSLSGCDTKAVIDNGVTVHLKMVGGASDDQRQGIEESVNAMATALGQARLEQANGLGRRAASDASVSTKATLKSEANGGI